jgi:myo-inositol catabolism protein IolC
MMGRGYNRPLYLLPFDHRHSYVTGMFHFTPPLTADQHDTVADSKQVIYDGFRQAIGEGVPKPRAGILVDEEFGAGILRDAIAHGYVTALSTEKSGSDEFELEYGTAFINATGLMWQPSGTRQNQAMLWSSTSLGSEIAFETRRVADHRHAAINSARRASACWIQ